MEGEGKKNLGDKQRRKKKEKKNWLFVAANSCALLGERA